MADVPAAGPRRRMTRERRNLPKRDKFKEDVPILKPEKQGTGALEVKSVDFKKSANKTKHQTDDYEMELLILRRGQAFDLSITFNRKIQADDTIILQISTGDTPQESKGSLHRLHLQSQKKPEELARSWKVESVKITDKTISASVTPYPAAIIGYYKVFVETTTAKDDEINRFEVKDEPIVVLFNAFCKEDLVYMENEEERQEYVMNPSGEVFGPTNSPWYGKAWNFGQFDSPCLEAALYLLDESNLDDVARASPISVLRAISALVNNFDDNGVVAGNWSGDYPEGTTSPSAWAGSVAILDEYMETRKPVRYGQCWVFSAVSTTLCRALGIPTRSVTNFGSAHDTDGSLTIDKHYNEEGKPIEWRNNDSVWNFHVWNESWLKRPDLPPGYDGWQAHDATPQEESNNVYRCGPASVKAIKEGHVYLCYDTGFVFSEVNGDKINWMVKDDGSMTVTNIDHDAVGERVVTKNPKKHHFGLDLTGDYKYPDGSEKGRAAVKFASQFGSRAHLKIYDQTITRDVEFALTVPEEKPITNDLTITIVMKNTATAARHVKGRTTLFSASYTGIVAKSLKDQHLDETIEAGKEKKVTLTLTPAEFHKKMNPEADFQAVANYKVTETGQQWATSKAISLTKPRLTVKVPEEILVKTTKKGKVSFSNPLTIPITGAEIQVEGGMAVKAKYKHEKSIAPNETITFEFDITPAKKGVRQIEASFTSHQMTGVDGVAEFTAIPQKEEETPSA